MLMVSSALTACVKSAEPSERTPGAVSLPRDDAVLLTDKGRRDAPLSDLDSGVEGAGPYVRVTSLVGRPCLSTAAMSTARSAHATVAKFTLALAAGGRLLLLR